MQRRVCQHQKQGKRTCKHVETWTMVPFCLAIAATTLAAANPVLAQSTIVPDTTLGTENSTLNRDVMIRGILSDRVEGGAARGSNLFHSFEQFNVGAGRGVYFANPAGIENILSRVTGSNRSEILGRLGVLGNANLFLLNPTGILFGANASLDLTGSFTATTANAIQLGNQGFFSATQPQQSILLAITPGALLYNQIAAQGGRITNAGNLAAGQDLTLAANTLDLQGQLQAGRDLTLQAQDTVRIRDSATAPFIASAGRNLLVQGNQTVDIFALNHPNSGLFSGGNMVLRSANQVGGDAHYYSGGNFRIEQLNGDLGDLYSPNDPVIRSLGDVRFDAYLGNSLHILAAGAVEIPRLIQITGSDPDNGLAENVTLSNGSIVPIDGRSQPTLDIRAGVNPDVVGRYEAIGTGLIFNPFPTVAAPTFTALPTSANINVGNIILAGVAGNPLAGTVLLTNQYRPNPNLSGDIQIATTQGQLLPGVAIRAEGLEGGGLVAIDSRGGLNVNGIISTSPSFPATGGFLGNGGDITLLSSGDMTFTSTFPLSIRSQGNLGGNILLKSNANITLNGGGIANNSFTTVVSKGGDINLTAQSLSLLNGSQLSTTTVGDTATLGRATAGNINITVSELFNAAGRSSNGLPNRISSEVGETANAQGGNINISAGSISISDGTQISASLFGQGSAGNINIRDTDSVALSRNSSLFANVEAGAIGSGGGINIRANSLSITEGSQVQTVVKSANGILGAGQGIAGNITVDVRDNVTISGARNGFFTELSSDLNSGAIGEAGNISVTTKTGSIFITDGAALRANTTGQGNAGNILIQANNSVLFAGNSFLVANVESAGLGDAGNINILAKTLSITGGSQIQSLIREGGRGSRSNININVLDTITLSGVQNGLSSAIINTIGPGASGTVGNINVNARSMSVIDGAFISANTQGLGDAGNIKIRVRDDIHIQGQGTLSGTFRIPSTISTITASISGDGGDIDISAGSLQLADGASLISSTFGQGNAGNISLSIRGLLQANDGTISTVAAPLSINDARSSGGAIEIAARGIRLRGNSDITTFVTGGAGGGGNITLAADSILAFGDSDILTFSERGRGGNITLNTRAFFGQNYRPAPFGTDPRTLDNNNRVDINASGAVFGIVTLPDVSFIQNSLTQLPQVPIDTNTLLANSCIVRRNQPTGNFFITGSGGLPERPGTAASPAFPTGEVQNVEQPEVRLRHERSAERSQEPGTKTQNSTLRTQNSSARRPWKIGDPIAEPDGVYQLPDGQLVLSHECL